MTSEDGLGIDRRTVLKTLGASTAAGLAGCSDLTSRYYAAVPVVVDGESRSALGYEGVGHDRVVEEREASVGPLDGNVVAESYLFSYQTAETRDLSTGWPASESPTVGVLSTPRIEALGEVRNPLVSTPVDELMASSRGTELLARAGIIDDGDRDAEWRVRPERVDRTTTQSGFFEDEVPVERYLGVVAESDGPGRAVYVDAVRESRGNDEVLVTAGEQRALTAQEGDALSGSECETLNCLDDKLEFEERFSVVETILESVVLCPAFDGVDPSDRSGVDLDDCVNVSGEGDSMDFLHLDLADVRLVQQVEDTVVEQSGGSATHTDPDPPLVDGQNAAVVFDFDTSPSSSLFGEWNTSVQVDIERRFADGSTDSDRFFIPNDRARDIIDDTDSRAVFHHLAGDGNSATDPAVFAASTDLESVRVTISAQDDLGWSVNGDDVTIEASAGDFEVRDLDPLRVGFVGLLDDDNGSRYGTSRGGIRDLVRSFESATEYLQRVFPGDVVTYLHTDAGIVGKHEQSGLFVDNCEGTCVIYQDMQWATRYLDNQATSSSFPSEGTLRLDGRGRSSMESKIRNEGFDVAVAIVPGVAAGNSDASDYYDYFGRSASGLAFGDPAAAVSSEGAAPRGDDQPYSTTVAQEVGHYFQDDYRNPSGHPMAQRDDEGTDTQVNGVPVDSAHARHQNSDLRDRDTNGDGNDDVNNPPDPPGVVSVGYELTDGFTNLQSFENPNGSFSVDGPDSSASSVGTVPSYMSYGRSSRSWTDARVHGQLIDSGWNAAGTSGNGTARYMLSATGGVTDEGGVQYREVAALPGFDEYTDREDGPVTAELLGPDGEVLASARVPLDVSATHGHGEPVEVPAFTLPFDERGVRVRTTLEERSESFNPVVRSVADALQRVPAHGVRGEPVPVRDDEEMATATVRFVTDDGDPLADVSVKVQEPNGEDKRRTFRADGDGAITLSYTQPQDAGDRSRQFRLTVFDGAGATVHDETVSVTDREVTVLTVSEGGSDVSGAESPDSPDSEGIDRSGLDEVANVTLGEIRRAGGVKELSEVAAAMDEGAYGTAADVMDESVRSRIQEQVVDYDAALNEPTREELLALVDEMVGRLRTLGDG